MKVRVKVPATSANMGAGFDTLGVALNLYNKIEVEEIAGGLEIFSLDSGGYIPKDERNLIYRAIKTVFDYVGYEEKGLKITQNSEIPMTRGLGSSSACIVGGMLCANVISGRKLSYNQIINLAAKMEGHPDNVGPALYGGFCVSLMESDVTIVKSVKIDARIRFALMIPDYFVATKRSREVLPDKVSFRDAVYNVAHASMLQAAFVSGDTQCLKYGVKDRLHQQYRKNYIDNMEDIFSKTYSLGACATYLSGSGPTILSILDGNYNEFEDGMKKYFKDNSHKWNCKIVEINNVGSVVSVID